MEELSQFFAPVLMGPNETIGVRVQVEMQYQGPMGRIFYYQTVTINATSETTVDEVMSAATAFVEAGGLHYRSGHDSPGEWVNMEISGLVFGGIDMPGITLHGAAS